MRTTWHHRAVRWLATIGPVMLVVLAGCTTGRPFRPALETYMQGLGFEPVVLDRDRHNHLLARCELNGKQRRLAVDTGWSLTAVDRSTAGKLPTLEQLGVQFSEPRMTLWYGASSVMVPSLKLGSAMFTNQVARVQDLRVTGIDGILGADFLLRHHGVIDCLDERLYVRSAATSPDEQQALEALLLRSGFHPVKLELRSSLVANCDGRINGKPIKLLVDTGSQWSLLDSSQVPRLGLKPVRTSDIAFGALSQIRPVRLAAADIKALELPGVTLANLRFGVAPLADWGIRAPGWSINEVHGLLGGYDLALAGALIDCEHAMLWLKPVGK